MKTLEFNITIDASREKVWDTLLGKDSYPQWTKPFSESSAVETDWKKGSKALFLDGNGHGMVSEIAENIPNEYLSIRHLGQVTDGVEDTVSEKVKTFSGSLENYTLKTVDGKTELNIQCDVPQEFEEFMNNTWPQALDKVKEISESAG